MDVIAFEGNHVEPAMGCPPLESPPRKRRKKPLRGANQTPLLGHADAAGRPAEAGCLARANLDEDKFVAIARHQIDLAQGAPEVARQTVQARLFDQPQRNGLGVHAALLGGCGRSGRPAGRGLRGGLCNAGPRGRLGCRERERALFFCGLASLALPTLRRQGTCLRVLGGGKGSGAIGRGCRRSPRGGGLVLGARQFRRHGKLGLRHENACEGG